MKLTTGLMVAFSTLALAAGGAFAQGYGTPDKGGQGGGSAAQPPMSGTERPAGTSMPTEKQAGGEFNTLDKDGDGSISKSEAAGAREVSKNFSRLDKNRDGKIDRTEYGGMSK